MADEVAQFIEALNQLNANTTSLVTTLESVQRAVAEKPKVKASKPKRQPDKTPEEKEEEFWEGTEAASQVSKIVGENFSSVTILHDLREVEKKIHDVTKAQELGIISFRDSIGMLATLGSEYASLKAVAAGKALGGQAGAKLTQSVLGAPKAGARFVMSQVTGLATGAMGLLGGTALAGGLFGLMLHGVMEADRLAAEAGEITNIFSAAGATASKAAIGHFAAFQETAQTFYGISRQEVQGVLREFLLAGVSIEEIMAGGRKGMGVVGHDAVTLSMGMDALFELGSGFTAEQAMQLVQQQGLGVGEAVDKMTKIQMLAHRSSVSVSDFTTNVVTATTELKDYGVRVDSVAVGMTLLAEKFGDIGLNAQAAMEYAQQGVKEITSGLKGAGLGVQGLLAQQLGYGGDGGASLSGRYEMLDKLQSGSKEDFVQIVKGLHGVAATQTKGTYGGTDEVRQREYLERQGFGLMGAKAIYTIATQVDSGQAIDEVSKEEWTAIRTAFQVEGSKISDLQKKSAKFAKALAKMGQGILFTITNFMALMIISIKTILSIDWKMEFVEGVVKSTIGLSAAKMLRGFTDATGLSGTTEADTAAVMGMFRTQWRATTRAAGKAYSGMSDSLGALDDIVRPLMRPIFIALDFKSGGDMSETMDDATAEAEGRKTLTPEFWAAFDEMCKRQGVDPMEMRKMLGAEHGFRIWGSHRVNYVVDERGKYKIDPGTGKRIAQAKGMGAWVWATAHASGMSRSEWERLEYMPAMEQLPFLERTMRMMGIKGLSAEAIHVKWMGSGFMAGNPHNAIAVASWWWDTPDGQAWIAAGGKISSRIAQHRNYTQNKAYDKAGKGYITAADLDKSTIRCPVCKKVLLNCKCPKRHVSVEAKRTSAPKNKPVVEVTVTFATPATVMEEAARPTFTTTVNPTSTVEILDPNLARALATEGVPLGE